MQNEPSSPKNDKQDDGLSVWPLWRVVALYGPVYNAFRLLAPVNGSLFKNAGHGDLIQVLGDTHAGSVLSPGRQVKVTFNESVVPIVWHIAETAQPITIGNIGPPPDEKSDNSSG